jgi:hypothetical protein
MTTGSMEWNIRAPKANCESCNKPFQDREVFCSRLEFGAEGYVRRDYCSACWTGAARQGALSVWKTEYRTPSPPPPEPIQRETAESLLRKLLETEDPANLNVVFILAVMLERKRILVERDVQVREDGVKVRVYEHRKTGESLVITDPQLRLAELERVQAEVVARLGGAPNGGSPADGQPGGTASETNAGQNQGAAEK